VSYLDRLRACHYITPSGNGFELQFTELSRSGAKKAAVHEFPQSDTPEIQDLGNTGQRFPLTAVFDGPDYDLAADSFVEGLSEKGPGKLHHPRWGDMLALPLSWKQSERFVDGMGRAEFDVEFARVDEIRYPITTVSIESDLADSLNVTAEMARVGFDKGWQQIIPVPAMDAAAGKAQLLTGLQEFSKKMQDVVAENAEKAEEFNRTLNTITGTYDTLILDPSAAAASVITLLRLPASAVTSIVSKIKGYAVGIATLVQTLSPASIAQSLMGFLQLFGLGLGLADSSLAGTLNDREAAADAAGATQDAADALTEAVESIEDTGFSADSALMAALKAVLATATALLLEKSFSLRAARRVTLTRDSTPLDLVWELMAPASGDDLEAALDAFIAQNHLGGDALLLIPAGREVAYYAG
jgi:hypothetical protein